MQRSKTQPQMVRSVNLTWRCWSRHSWRGLPKISGSVEDLGGPASLQLVCPILDHAHGQLAHERLDEAFVAWDLQRRRRGQSVREWTVDATGDGGPGGERGHLDAQGRLFGTRKEVAGAVRLRRRAGF